MIAWIQGRLISTMSNTCIISVQGLGYEVMLMHNDWHALPALGESVTLFIHTVYREDNQSMYGFINAANRQAFVILNTASGVGPKMALSMLDTYGVNELSLLIAQGNFQGLTRVKGVGPKLAKRLVLDLKDKLVVQSCPDRAMQSTSMIEDVVGALVKLGYKDAKARQMAMQAKGNTVEALIKHALQNTELLS